MDPSGVINGTMNLNDMLKGNRARAAMYIGIKRAPKLVLPIIRNVQKILNKRVGPRVLTGDFRCTPPENYYIETSSLCNLRCPFCPTGRRVANMNSGFLSYKNALRILKEIQPWARHVSLFNWGEPFLNPHLLKIVEAFSRYGITTSVSTNFSIRDLTPEDAMDIVKSGLTSLIISIDGATQDSYGRYRVGGNLQRVLRNMALVVEARALSGGNSPSVVWQFLINKFNEHEIAMAKGLANDMGVSIELKYMDVPEGEWQTKFHIEGGQPHQLNGKNPGDSRIDNNKIPLPALASAIRLHPSLWVSCMNPFDWMNIHIDGSVRPCCVVTDESFIVGNIFNSGIERVWNGVEMRRCREFLCNYGPRQLSRSKCELYKCGITKKHVEVPRVCGK
jgi:MoaA/NifB/PqqE/SkfB family radical SAM enzyme